MSTVSAENLVGEQIPNVFIKAICLDQEGGDAIGKEANPHIDVSDEPYKQRNRDGSYEWVYPPVNYTSTAKTTSSALLIKIQVMLKDKKDGTWSANEEVMKYLKVRILESRDNRFSDQIKSATYSLDPNSYRRSLYSNYAKEITIDVRDAMRNLHEYESIKDSDGNMIYNVVIEERFALSNAEPQHLSYFAVAFYDTEQMIEDYGLDLPNHLKKAVYSSVAAETVIDLGQVMDTATAYVLRDGGQIYGGPKHQVPGRIQWWTGASHVPGVSKKLRKIPVPNITVQDNRKLDESEEIQIDFSQLESELLGITGDISKVSNNTLSLYGVKPAYFTDLMLTRNSAGDAMYLFSFDYKKILQEQTKFGKLMTSPDENVAHQVISRCRVRHIKVYRNRVVKKMAKTRLGNDIEDIVPIKINNYGSGYDFEPPEMVAYASQQTTGRMPQAQLYRDQYGHLVTSADLAHHEDEIVSLSSQVIIPNRPKRVGSIEEIALSVQDANPGIRTFMGIDDSVSDLTDGLYQYSVEIEIQDSTINWFKTLTRQLKLERNKLEEYYNEGIDARNYERTTDKFKQSYIDSKSAQYRTKLSAAPYVSPIAKYLEVMNIVTFNEFAIKNAKYAKSIFAMISPQSGSPSGVLAFIKIVNSLVDKMEKLLGEKVDMTHSGAKNGSRATSRQASGINSFKIEKSFNATFDSNVLKETGYDYLEDQPNTIGNGLKVIDGMEYHERCTTETEKYFSKTNTTFNLSANGVTYSSAETTRTTELTYLSPAKVEVNGESLHILGMGNTTHEPNQYTAMESLISSAKSNPNRLGSTLGVPITHVQDVTLGGEKVVTNLAPIVATAGVTLMSLQDYAIKINSEEQEDGYVEAREYFDDESHLISGSLKLGTPEMLMNSLDNQYGAVRSKLTAGENASSILTTVMSNSKVTGFALDTTPTSMFTVNTPDNSIVSNTNTNLQVFNLANTMNGLELMRNSPLPSSAVSALPNQLKSLMYASTGGTQLNINLFDSTEDVSDTSETEGYFRFNYQMLMEIEVLSGFGTNTNNQAQLRDMQWTQLTEDQFNSSTGKMLLCRMKSYTNPTFGIYEAEGLSLPTYNEYFILTPTTQINVPSPVSIPMKTSPLLPSGFDTSKIEFVVSAVKMEGSTSDIVSTVPSEFVSTTTVLQTTAGTTLGTSSTSATMAPPTATQMTTGGGY